MNGRTGTKVSVRHLPHHDDTIEVFDTATGRHLGSAFLAAAASREQIRCRRLRGGETPTSVQARAAALGIPLPD
ncbi:hypothetical protein OHA79_46565 (plasmid) [Streptomyces sp. NBC_00841]|uniref:hypothetical protein n=1 Tax=unclassified Streptomyces TaxID=2593676 RepID=UPI0022555C7D|nr:MULTISPECIES: hypothetical protein [unclassified Streptomyces]MCX4537894.1 hypothetical protein [Streptomyces sp. NBC_01669]WSA05087.1 hypothetical protein OHA79_46565 [Streptomyces sp. NBC_00841]